MIDITNQTVAEMVVANYRTADVFKKYGIDFCCGGGKSVQQACLEKEVPADDVLAQLKEIFSEKPDENLNFESWPIDELANFIETTHHKYVAENIPLLLAYLERVVKVHGSHHPELGIMLELFRESAGDLTMHMKKEELILFPFVKKMVKAAEKGEKVEQPHFGTVENPVAMMKDEHDTEGERFRQIAALANNYNPPADACNTYRVTFKKLQEFENDLHMHIHLENNILFPKAIELQEQTKQ